MTPLTGCNLNPLKLLGSPMEQAAVNQCISTAQFPSPPRK